MSELTLDVGLAAKLKMAFARNGWTAEWTAITLIEAYSFSTPCGDFASGNRKISSQGLRFPDAKPPRLCLGSCLTTLVMSLEGLDWNTTETLVLKWKKVFQWLGTDVVYA